VKWEPHKHDGLLIAVELELNGDVHTLPCPLIRDESGTADYEAIRRYFEEQDFSVCRPDSEHSSWNAQFLGTEPSLSREIEPTAVTP